MSSPRVSVESGIRYSLGMSAAVWYVDRWVDGKFESAVGCGSLVGGWITDEGYFS